MKAQWGVVVLFYSLFNLGATGDRTVNTMLGIIMSVPTVHEAGRAPGLVWTGAENLAPTSNRSPKHPSCRVSLYRLCCPPTHKYCGNRTACYLPSTINFRLHELKCVCTLQRRLILEY